MMDIAEDGNKVYDKNTIEFVAVAKTYCEFINQLDSVEKEILVSTMLKLLPLIYQKASFLPDVELLGDGYLEQFATETDYGHIESSISGILSNDDAYLEVFHPEINMSDTPVVAYISTSLADIWQDLYNFVSVYRLGLNETMNDALYICKNNFGKYWGRAIVNVMRALHDVKYKDVSNADYQE